MNEIDSAPELRDMDAIDLALPALGNPERARHDTCSPQNGYPRVHSKCRAFSVGACDGCLRTRSQTINSVSMAREEIIPGVCNVGGV